jgi:hypothetical protein
MSRVITFSKEFQKSHKRSGERTFFREKILTGLVSLRMYPRNQFCDEEIFNTHGGFLHIPKLTTIRAGHRWKVGDRFSPREWVGKPYRSKQRILCPDLEVKHIYNFSFTPSNGFILEGHGIDIEKTWIAQNDGLSVEDFKAWFNSEKGFFGQIVSWVDKLNYKKVIAENSPAVIWRPPF